MKKLIMLLILIQSIIPILSAQSYKPILKEENSWNVFWGQCDASMVDSTFSINDSIVDSKIYATLYSGQISNKIGYLEEDTIQGKLTYHDNSGKSYVVFDISLVPGDTVKFTGYYDNQVELIVSDTTTLNDLKYIEFKEGIQMCSFDSKFIMIESVGPNVGIQNVGKYYNYSFENYLLCNYKSGEFYFGNDLFNGECYVNWTGIESNNPSDQIRINIHGNELTIANLLNYGKLTIYNIQGSLLFERKINSGSNSISLQDFKPGIYIYLIVINNEVIADKFMKY